MVTLATGALQKFTFRIPDVPIWVSVIDLEREFSNGEVFVNVNLGIEDNQTVSLCSGYVSGIQDISWPSLSIKKGVPEKMGRLVQITTADPAAGAELSHTVPAGVIWKIKAIAVALVTDATVANRKPHFVFTGASGLIANCWSVSNIQASLTTTIIAGLFVLTNTSLDGGTSQLALPHDLYLKEGDTITTITSLMAAGDNYGAAIITVEEFLV
jgi:hypothetical protein